MIRRYGFDGIYSAVFGELENGQYVKHSDHEAAIAEARKQERQRCIAELAEISKESRSSTIDRIINLGVEHLRKGLSQ